MCCFRLLTTGKTVIAFHFLIINNEQNSLELSRKSMRQERRGKEPLSFQQRWRFPWGWPFQLSASHRFHWECWAVPGLILHRHCWFRVLGRNSAWRHLPVLVRDSVGWMSDDRGIKPTQTGWRGCKREPWPASPLACGAAAPTWSAS